ncbi:hypothetical protein sscle_06g048600 [Sclerotinia sclerotiorum 1980 UF-70]|uniref:Enoyl reductase (ER) domain-containing protein n=1 Tax=Sclerotinia sclerotiorum (strain ATCC 18683 / 1980 / Ss-1) TaxID=665079 RepID=A0A1D9Q558_SCLS1|nr:hypothetical protein sscle_06g048600 [Sclerotinia sclerotiorum 1980 UF-70]
MAATQQQSLVIQEVGKRVVKIIRPIPTPKENEVLIKVTSAGINPSDCKSRETNLFNLTLPSTLCTDAAGIITAKGDKVSGFELNDHVFGYSSFTIDSQASQQYAVLEVGSFAKVPSNITDDQAATLPVNLFTSALSFWSENLLGFPAPWTGNKTPDAFSEAVVILGGGGSCGKFAVQVAKISGIGKIVVISSKSHTEELKSYGATHVIDRHSTDAEIRGLVHGIVGDGLSYVFDTINEDHSLAVSLLSGNKRGKVVTLLYPNSAPGNYDVVMTFGLAQLHKEFSAEFFKQLQGWLESGKIKPLGFKLLEGGLDEEVFNKLLDDHLNRKNPGKWHFHPNDI